MSKGAVVLFFKWTDLGSDVCITAAEVDDAYDVCNQIKVVFNTKIASISMDNAASKVAERVAQKVNADGDPTLPLHNPANCIDLLSKDLSKSSVVRSVLSEANEVFDLFLTNQIDSIHKETIDASNIPASIVAQNVCETCMNLTYIHLKSALAQSTFIASLPTNDRYIKYYMESSSERKQELDGILQNCNHGRWHCMLMLINLAKVFYDSHRLCSCNDAPLSSYDLIVQAIKNAVDCIIKGKDGKFDWILGHGSADAISTVASIWTVPSLVAARLD